MSGMHFLLEKGKCCYTDREYRGETPYEVGVSFTQPSLWGEEVVTRYLFELLEDISDKFGMWRKVIGKEKDQYFVYFGYHVTNVPMTWDECEELHAARVMGAPEKAGIHHHYSDLTGYLWTTVNILDGEGHNLYVEITTATSGYTDADRYLCMKFEILKKSG